MDAQAIAAGAFGIVKGTPDAAGAIKSTVQSLTGTGDGGQR